MRFRASFLAAVVTTLLAVMACSSGGDDAIVPVTTQLAQNTRAPQQWLGYLSTQRFFGIAIPISWTADPPTTAQDIIKAPGFGSADSTSVTVEFGSISEVEATDPDFPNVVKQKIRDRFHADARTIGVYNFGGRPGLLVDFVATGQYSGYGMQAWIPNHGNGWVISLATSVEKQAEHRETFEEMLDSFTPMDTAPAAGS